MLCKNITKKISFVTIFAFLCLNLASCSLNGFGLSNQNGVSADAEDSKEYGSPKVLGRISSDEINESSGLAASRCNEGVLWTHNDSGDQPFIYALNLKGEKIGTWRVTGAKNSDWEDLATYKNENGECFLYIGDIGNNERVKAQLTIYRVAEPKISANADHSSRKNPPSTETAQAIKVLYPDSRHNAETLMVHPKTGDVYILTKEMTGASGVYKLPANYNPDKTNRLEKIADFRVPAIPDGFLTGGEIAPDGNRVVISDYFAGYEILLPAKTADFDEIWKEKPLKIELGERKQGEAVSYSADGKSIFATSEGKNSPLIEVDRK